MSFIYTIRKITVLTIIAVLTSFITFVLFGLYNGTVGFMVRIDQMINISCLMLMYKAYDRHYKMFCIRIHNCIKYK